MHHDLPITSGIPSARIEGLAITVVAGECLVYDTERHHLHRLNPIVSAIWHALDGVRDLGAVAAYASDVTGIAIDVATARRAIDQLTSAHLLDSAPTWPRSTTRRTFMRGVAAGAVAFPTIVSITAPVAANGISPLDCDPRDDQCQSGFICAGNGGEYPFLCREGDACRPACTEDAQCWSPNWERSGRGGGSETCGYCIVVCLNPDTQMKEHWAWGYKELPDYCGSPENGTCGTAADSPGTWTPAPTCFDRCDSDETCQHAPDGCTVCRWSDFFQEARCQEPLPPPVCGALCDSNDYCSDADDGCTLCLLNEETQEWRCGQSDRDRRVAPQSENRTLAAPPEPDPGPTPTLDSTAAPEPPTPTTMVTEEPIGEQIQSADTGDSSSLPETSDDQPTVTGDDDTQD